MIKITLWLDMRRHRNPKPPMKNPPHPPSKTAIEEQMATRLFRQPTQTTRRTNHQNPSSTKIYPGSKLVFQQPPSHKSCRGNCLALPQLAENWREQSLFILSNKIIGGINRKRLGIPSLPDPTIHLTRNNSSLYQKLTQLLRQRLLPLKKRCHVMYIQQVILYIFMFVYKVYKLLYK